MLKLHHDSQLDPRINVNNNFVIYIMIYMRKSINFIILTGCNNAIKNATKAFSVVN